MPISEQSLSIGRQDVAQELPQHRIRSLCHGEVATSALGKSLWFFVGAESKLVGALLHDERENLIDACHALH
jgi:hypothetical protein